MKHKYQIIQDALKRKKTDHCDSKDEDECEWSQSDDNDSDGPIRKSGVVGRIRGRGGQFPRHNYEKTDQFWFSFIL